MRPLAVRHSPASSQSPAGEALQDKPASHLVSYWRINQLLLGHPGVLGGASPSCICNRGSTCLCNTLQGITNGKPPAGPEHTAAWLDYLQSGSCLKPNISEVMQSQSQRLNIAACRGWQVQLQAAAQACGCLVAQMDSICK